MFHILTSEDIDDVISRFFSALCVNSQKWRAVDSWSFLKTFSEEQELFNDLLADKSKKFQWPSYKHNEKNIARQLEDMNLMFSWQEQYLTSECGERVRYCSWHENIKLISSRHHVALFSGELSISDFYVPWSRDPLGIILSILLSFFQPCYPLLHSIYSFF